MKINLGSGPYKGEQGWTNIDCIGGADIKADLTNGIPFDSNTIESIYSSHFLEHLYYPEICKLLLEAFRVIIPGGKISICVPNAKLFIQSYMNNDLKAVCFQSGEIMRVPSFIIMPGESIYPEALIKTGSSIDWVNYIAYSNSEHKYMFDEENLISHLRRAGFKKACLRKFDPKLDNKHAKFSSIYAHAIKEIS